MSNVFRRFHHPTGVEYFDNAAALGIELERILTNPKIVPKSRRFIYTIPILNIWNREWMWIGIGFDAYPAGNEAQAILDKKKKAFQKAIDANESIIRALQQMVITHKEIDVDRLNHLGDLLVLESTLLKKAKDNSRIQQVGKTGTGKGKAENRPLSASQRPAAAPGTTGGASPQTRATLPTSAMSTTTGIPTTTAPPTPTLGCRSDSVKESGLSSGNRTTTRPSTRT